MTGRSCLFPPAHLTKGSISCIRFSLFLMYCLNGNKASEWKTVSFLQVAFDGIQKSSAIAELFLLCEPIYLESIMGELI